jgi:hypothetical protein
MGCLQSHQRAELLIGSSVCFLEVLLEVYAVAVLADEVALFTVGTVMIETESAGSIAVLLLPYSVVAIFEVIEVAAPGEVLFLIVVRK